MNTLKINNDELTRYCLSIKKIQEKLLSDSLQIRKKVVHVNGWLDDGYVFLVDRLNKLFSLINIVLDKLGSFSAACKKINEEVLNYSSFKV